MPADVSVAVAEGANANIDDTRYGSPLKDINDEYDGVLYLRWARHNSENVTIDPIIPGAGTVYSWAKTVYMYVITTPVTAFSNLRFFSASSVFGGSYSGCSVYSRVQDGVYIAGYAGDESGLRENMAIHTEASILVVKAGSFNVESPGVPNIANAFGVELQLSATPAMPAGVTPAMVHTFRYEES